MKNSIQNFLYSLLAGANIMTILLMLTTGYSDWIDPREHELLACSGMVFPFFVIANLLFIVVWVIFSWKRLPIPIIGLLLAYPAIRVYMPLHGKQDVPEKSLCVISYNVCTFGGNYKYEHAFDSIFAFIERNKADIVCLQEDIHSPLKDYERYFPYNDTTIVSAYNIPIYNAVGIHSRFPILKKEVINYHSATNGSVAYFLLIEGDTVIVVNNHLESSHLSSDDRNRYQELLKGEVERQTAKSEAKLLAGKLSQAMAIRAEHVDSIRSYVDRHSQYPIIICGDFNDTPISYTHRRMTEGLTDCYVESGRGPGLSYNRLGFNFRIDHMICSSHFEPYACEIDNGIDFSDHYPLICWLKKRENP